MFRNLVNTPKEIRNLDNRANQTLDKVNTVVDKTRKISKTVLILIISLLVIDTVLLAILTFLAFRKKGRDF